MTNPDCVCADCGHVFPMPAVAKCPVCPSRQIRRHVHTEATDLARTAHASSMRQIAAELTKNEPDLDVIRALVRAAGYEVVDPVTV